MRYLLLFITLIGINCTYKAPDFSVDFIDFYLSPKTVGMITPDIVHEWNLENGFINIYTPGTSVELYDKNWIDYFGHRFVGLCFTYKKLIQIATYPRNEHQPSIYHIRSLYIHEMQHLIENKSP